MNNYNCRPQKVSLISYFFFRAFLSRYSTVFWTERYVSPLYFFLFTKVWYTVIWKKKYSRFWNFSLWFLKTKYLDNNFFIFFLFNIRWNLYSRRSLILFEKIERWPQDVRKRPLAGPMKSRYRRTRWPSPMATATRMRTITMIDRNLGFLITTAGRMCWNQRKCCELFRIFHIF